MLQLSNIWFHCQNILFLYNKKRFGISYQNFPRVFHLDFSSHVLWFADNPKRGMVGDPAYLKEWVRNALPKLGTGDSTFKVEFEWDEEHGVPGAVIVKNKHHFEFYLKSISLDDVPGRGPIHFVCNSWIYPAKKYKYDRVFFSNDVSIAFPWHISFCCFFTLLCSSHALIRCTGINFRKIE